MDRCFPKILRGYILKQKRKNLFVLSKLSVKINSTACFISSVGPGNGGGGVYFFNQLLFVITGPNGGGGRSGLYNRLIPNFEMNIKVKK